MKWCYCCGRQLPATDHFFDLDEDGHLTLNCWRCSREAEDRNEADRKAWAERRAKRQPVKRRAPNPKMSAIRAAVRAALVLSSDHQKIQAAAHKMGVSLTDGE